MASAVCVMGAEKGHLPCARVEAGWFHEGTLSESTGFEDSQIQESKVISLVAQTLKNLPALHEMQETWVPYPGREDPLEKGMATHSSIPAWRIPWTEEPGGLQPVQSKNWTQLSD